MSVDLKLAEQLIERLTEIETSAINRLPGALPFEKYHQSCGYLEAVRQIRDQLIPEISNELQRS